MGWLFVPGAADLKPRCTSSLQDIAPFVLSKGKLTPQPPLWSGWKKRKWARVLCGMTLPPSTLARGVDSWISSLRDTRASHSATPEKALEKMTQDISGLLSTGTFARLCPPLCSAKMLQLTLPGVLTPSKETLSELATRLRQESLARRKSALRTLENDFLSLDNWPTVTAHGNHNRKGISPKAGDGLATAVSTWPTPAAAQFKQGQNNPDGIRGQTLIGALRGQMWPTIKASDGPKGGPNQRWSKGDLALPATVQEWATPTESIATGGQTSRGGPRKEELLLAGQVMWGTPTTMQSGPDYARSARRASGADDIVTQVATWGTPTARDYKSGRGMRGQLTTHLQDGRGRQDAELTSTDGKSPGLLNPEWVEQLMGWAPGQSSFLCSETEWCRWLVLWRLWLFGRS